MFTVTCIGRNGLYPTKDEATSGYLVDMDGMKILLDVGAGVFPRLLDMTLPEDLFAVVVSHFHGDHCADLAVFDYYLQSKRAALPLFAPTDNFYDVRDLRHFYYTETYDGYRVDIEGADLSFFRTAHPRLCMGVRITYGGKTLVYSADTNVCDWLDEALEGADLAILDSAFDEQSYKQGGPHLSARLCGEYAKKHNVRTLLSHLNPTGDKEKLLSEAKEVSPLCEIIELKTYEIG